MTILALSKTTIVEDTINTRKAANEAVLSGLNAALAKVDQTFDAQTKKLEMIVNKTQKKKIRDNVLIFISGILVGLIICAVSAGTMFIFR